MVVKRTPMLEQYFAVKESYKDALLLFRLGDFYELFFEDAEVASDLLDLTLTGRGQGDNRAPMCGVPYHAADNYIAKLVAAGYKVAICDQVEDPKNAKGIVKREVTRLVTPGTGFDYLKDEEARTLVATASTEVDFLIGAVADSLTGDVWLKKGERSALHEWWSQLGVSEVVATETATEDNEWLRTTADALRCAFSLLPRQELLSATQLTAAEVLQSYLEYTGRKNLLHIKAPVWVADSAYLQINGATMSHLELLRPQREGRKGATLLEVIDFTKTVLGKRYLKRLLERPLHDVEQIQARQDSIAAWLNDVLFKAEVEESLKGIHDMERIVSRISFGSALPRDLVQLGRSLEAVTALRSLLQGKELVGEVAAAAVKLADFTSVCQRIGNCLVEEPIGTGKEGGIIRAGFDAEVDRLRDLVQGGRSTLAALEQSERARTGIRSLKIGYNRVFGYYIEVSSANLSLVPPDYERKQTLTNGERFVTPELRKREQEILVADGRLKELEWAHFVALIEEIKQDVRTIQDAAEAVGQLDALLSLAEAAKRHRYVRPQVDDSLELVIRQGRHPVVEHHVPGAYVPNDVRLNDDDRQIALITGPNMAGKSTYMRQVALIVVLAQCGSFVPAEFAHVGLVDKLFTRIGAADDVAAGLSTFMVEMTEAAEIMRQATPRSLILLDEIGRGTATYDGLSIAEAMVEHIHDHLQARTLFATHYHELTMLPARLSKVFNLSVAVVEHGEEIVFLHQIVERPADRSYGIQVARIAGIPASVTKRARQILKGLERRQKAASSVGEQIEFAFGGEEQVDESCQELRRELLAFNLDALTPRAALGLLYDLQTRFKEE